MEEKWNKNGTEMEGNGKKWNRNGTKMEEKWNQKFFEVLACGIRDSRFWNFENLDFGISKISILEFRKSRFWNFENLDCGISRFSILEF